MDQKLVQSGAAPPEDIQFDIALSKLIPEGEAIVAAHDQAKARDWSRRYNALMTRKNEVDQKYAAAHPFHFDPALQADPCISPAGQNTCVAPPVQAQQMCSVNYGSTVGLVPCG